MDVGERGWRWWRLGGSGGTRVRYLQVSTKRSRMLETGNDISIYLYYMNVLTHPILIKGILSCFILGTPRSAHAC
jgi:hypothetical protein